jgi:hypothetical protein
MFMGYMTHLVLDEIYSVDVFDARVKASFGTAVKLFDRKRMADTAVVAVLAAAAFFFTPSAKTFTDGITSRDLWTSLQQKLVPRDNTWFRVINLADGIAPAGRVTGVRADGSAIAIPLPASSLTTGSIPAPAAAKAKK